MKYWVTIFIIKIIFSKEMLLNKTYNIKDLDKNKINNIKLDKDYKNINLVLEVSIEFELSIKNENGKDVKPKFIYYNYGNFFFIRREIIIIISSKYCKKGYEIEFKFRNFILNFKIYTKIFNEYIDFNFGDSKEYVSYFTNEIDFLVSKKKEFLLDKNSRLKFYLNSFIFNSPLQDGEKAIMLINLFENGLPTEEKYDLKSNGTLGTGLVGSINYNEPLFCKNENCKYYVKIIIKNFNQFYFFPYIFENYKAYPLLGYLRIIDQLEENEKITYELKPEKSKLIDYIFTIKPIEGNPDMYIHYNTLPKNLKDYKWKSNFNQKEDLLISKEELNKINNFEKFYVTLYSKQISVFTFLGRNIPDKNHRIIKLETYESGYIENEQIINYILFYYLNKEDSIKLLLNLKTEFGNVDLYFKECLLEEPFQNCIVNKNDIENKDILKNSKERIFNYSSFEGDDSLLLNFNCYKNPSIDFNKNNKDKIEFNNSYPISKRCVFAVAIHGKNNKYTNETFYNLLATGYENHLFLGLDKYLSVKGFKNNKKYIKFNLPQNLIKREDFFGVKIKFYILNGNCEIFWTKYNPYPSESDYIYKLNFLNFYNQILTRKQDIILNKKKIDLNGEFFIGININEYTNIQISLEPITTRNNNPVKLENSKLITNFFSKNNKFNSYFFKINIKEENVSINISLGNSNNHLKLCLQKNNENFDINKNCDYESDTKFLTFNSKQNKINGNYALGVINKDYDQNSKKFETYDLTYYLSFSESFIELNEPGKFFNGVVKNNLFFKINLYDIKEKLVIIFDTNSFEIEAYFSINVKMPNENDSQFNLNYNNSFILVKSDFIKKNCTNNEKNCILYLNIKNYNEKLAKEFKFSYTFDDYNFLCYNSITIPIPLFINETYKIYYSYLIKNQQNINISLNSITNETNLKGVINNEIDPNKKRPGNNIYDFLGEGENSININVNEIEYKNLESPEVQLFVEGKINNKNVEDENFIKLLKKNLAYLTITNEIIKLQEKIYYNNFLNKNSFFYYYIELFENETVVIKNEVQFGKVNWYINNGNYNFPTINTFDSIYEGSKEEIIELKKEKNDKTNGFTIGVYALEDSKYKINLLNKNSNIYIIENENILFNKFLKKEEIIYIIYNKNVIKNILYNSFNSIFNIDYFIFNPIINKINLENINDEKFEPLYVYNSEIGMKEFEFPNKIIACNFCNYIFRIENKKKDDEFNFMILNKEKIITLKENQNQKFIIKKNNIYYFKINSSNKYNLWYLDFLIKFGEIKFNYDYNINDLKNNNNYKLINNNHSTDIELKNIKLNDKNLNVKYKELFIKIFATDTTEFYISNRKKKNFIKLISNFNYFEKTSKIYDNYYYFKINPNLSHIQIDYMNKLDHSLFLTSFGKDFEEDKNHLKINNLFNHTSKLFDDVNRSQYSLSSFDGVYIIKIPKTINEKEFYIQIITYEEQIIKTNSLIFNNLFNKNNFSSYNIYYNEKGKAKLKIWSPISYNYYFYEIQENLKKLDIKFTKDEFGYDEINYNVNDNSKIKFDLLFNKNITNFDIYSEYKPQTKNLFLSEYFLINKTHNYEINLKNDKIIIEFKFKLPKVIKQFLKDYNLIEKIFIYPRLWTSSEKNINNFNKILKGDYNLKIIELNKKDEFNFSEKLEYLTIEYKLNKKENENKLIYYYFNYFIIFKELSNNNFENFIQIMIPVIISDLKIITSKTHSKNLYLIIILISLIILIIIIFYCKRKSKFKKIKKNIEFSNNALKNKI